MEQSTKGRNEGVVRAPTAMVRGEALPTLTKTKGFRCLLMLAAGQGKPKPGDIYEYPLNTLRDALNCRDDTHLAAELAGLGDLKVNWSRIYPDEVGFSRPVSSCTWNKQTGIVRWAFDPQFVKVWMDNSKGFETIDWEILVSFSSIYAAKIYEYCAMSHEVGKHIRTEKLNTDEVRELLAIPPTAYQGKNTGRLYSEIGRATETVNRTKPGFAASYCRANRGRAMRHWWEIDDAERQANLGMHSAKKVVEVGHTLHARIGAALAALPSEQRAKVETEVGYPLPASGDLTGLRGYAGRLRGLGVDLPPPA